MRHHRSLLLIFSVLFSLPGFAQAVDARKTLLDVQQYRFSIALNDKNDTIQGEAVITIRFLRASAGFDLDLVKTNAGGKGMAVLGVKEADMDAAFSQQNESLHITTAAKAGETRRYSIRYRGIPADGLIIATNKYGHRTFFADNWPNRAHHWLPCIDHPADKAPVEFMVTAPDHYQVVSNGLQVEESSLPNHYRLTHWKETVALPTKIMVIGAADFSVNRSGDVGAIPVYSWVYPENREQGFYDYAQACDILPFYIRNIGPFPYRKLANVQSKTIFGGMENAGAIFYHENSVTGDRSSESLLAHEIAHQWFGDNLTETGWQHIWLSEGFATYMTALYIEQAHGPDSMNRQLQEDRRRVIAFAAQSNTPVVDTTVKDNFMRLLNANSYQKGGWVLHMLRRRLGDIVFWKGIRAYYTAFAGANASTDDFRKAMETASGQDLGAFFHQWLYSPGLPVLNAVWQYDQVKHALSIDIQQTQPVPFSFPLELAVHGSGKSMIQSVTVTGRTARVSIPLAARPERIELDPHVNLLFSGEIKADSR